MQSKKALDSVHTGVDNNFIKQKAILMVKIARGLVRRPAVQVCCLFFGGM
jgi:hypothetical protein